MRRVLDAPNDELSLASQISPVPNDGMQVLQSLAFRLPSCRGQGSSRSTALLRHVLSSPIDRAGMGERTFVALPGEERRRGVASRGREVATSRLGRRYASPFTKERALAPEIDSGGGRHSGEMGGCHPGAMFLCAFDYDAGG